MAARKTTETVATAEATPLVAEIIRSFSDYTTTLSGIHSDNVGRVVAHYVANYDVVVKVSDEIVRQGAQSTPDGKAIGAWIRKGTDGTPLQWTITDATIDTVLWWGTRHTAARFATFTNLSLDKPKDHPMTESGYRKFLADVTNKRLDEAGKQTTYGGKVQRVAENNAAVKASVKVGAERTGVTVDFTRDLSDLTAEQKLEALYMTRQNLDADILAAEAAVRSGKPKVKADEAVAACKTAATKAVTTAAKATQKLQEMPSKPK